MTQAEYAARSNAISEAVQRAVREAVYARALLGHSSCGARPDGTIYESSPEEIIEKAKTWGVTPRMND